MAAIICDVHLPDKNGMPADDTVNTWVFYDTNPLTSPLTLASNINGPLEDFYNLGSTPVASFLANNLDRAIGAAHTVSYALADAGSVVPRTPLGGPIIDVHWNLSAAGVGSDLPRECASVLSIAGNMAGVPEDVPGGAPGPAGDTHPAARLRGRVYLGPFTTGAIGSGVNGPGVILQLRASATDAATALGTAIAAIVGGTVHWGVWSRVNHTIVPVTHGWMDDGWDTQRRRGIKAIVRSTFTI